MRIALYASVSLLAAAALGCGGGTGTLTGTVEYKGRKLAQGMVNVISESGASAFGSIQPDGSYRIDNCPTGKLKISVSSPNPADLAAAQANRAAARLSRGKPEAARPEPPTGDPATWFEIPEVLGRPDESGLSVEVSSGENRHDIKIE